LGKIEFRSFEDGRKYVRSLGLKSHKEWLKFCRSGKKPKDIPTYPYSTYKEKWKHIGDWLGIKTPHKFRKFRSFDDAKEFVRKLNLTSWKEWQEYCKSGNKPNDIPSAPEHQYKNKGWNGIRDWLGSNVLSQWEIIKKFKTFTDAKKFVQTLKLQSVSDWKKYYQSDNKPDNIPSNPNRTYKKEWKGWGDWLGTGNIAFKNIDYCPFNEARKFAHSLNLKNSDEEIKIFGEIG
jgi:hypothetical protein